MMAVTVMMAVRVVMMAVTMVMTSARAMMVSVMAGGPRGGRAANESSHCQAHQHPESSHWLPPSRCGSLPCSTRPNRMLDVGLIASPAEPAPRTASRQSRRAIGTGYCNA
jgi:hypothetical protein